MAMRPCTECREKGIERMTGLVVDGEPVCATCAAKMPPNARFQPKIDPVAEDQWGDPQLPPAQPVTNLCMRGCGKPPHRGNCAGVRRTSAPAPSLPPAQLIDLPPNLPEPIAPTPAPDAAPEPVSEPTQAEIDEISYVTFADIPPARPSVALSRTGRIFAAVLEAQPKMPVVCVQCRDKAHASKTMESVKQKARKGSVEMEGFCRGSVSFLWRKELAQTAAKGVN